MINRNVRVRDFIRFGAGDAPVSTHLNPLTTQSFREQLQQLQHIVDSDIRVHVVRGDVESFRPRVNQAEHSVRLPNSV